MVVVMNKNMKAGIAGLATGICLISFITLNNTNETDTTIETHTTTKTPPTTEIDQTTEEHKTTQTHRTDTKLWVWGIKIVSAGLSVGFWTAYLAQELDERRRYQFLCQSNRKIIKLLAEADKLDDNTKETLQNNLRDNLNLESTLLNGDGTPNSLNNSISHIKDSMDEKFTSVEKSLKDLNFGIESIKESNSDIKSILQERLTKVTSTNNERKHSTV